MMAEILLFNPPADIIRSHGSAAVFQTNIEPIGLAYIAAYIETKGFNIKLIDAYAEELFLEDILKIISKEHPKIVGFSSLTPNSPLVYELCKMVKNSFPDVIIVMGNIHPNVFYKETLKEGFADYIVQGEGEITFYELCDFLINGKGKIENILGIHYRENGELLSNAPRPFIKDLDTLPYPARHMLPMHKYSFFSTARLRRRGNIILATRGCPYRCTFCSIGNMGKVYRKRSPENICDEIEYMIDRYGTQQIGFIDAIFPLSKEHGIEFCKEMIRRGLNKKVVWSCETRVNILDKELAEAMKEGGCGIVCFGIESGVQKLLNNIKKGYTVQRAADAVKIAHKAGLRTVGFFMIGLPGETVELARETIDFACSIPLDFASFNLTVPYPGSELYEMVKREGRIKMRNWEDYSSYTTFSQGNPIYVPEGMTAEELMYLQKHAIKKFYLRPRMIYRHLFQLRQFTSRDYYYGFKMVYNKLFNKLSSLLRR